MKVWTFEIRGGSSFLLEPKAGSLTPVLHHEGKRTLWKMVGTEEQAQQVEAAIRDVPGCRVERFTEEQTPEQERERLMGPSEEE